MKKNIALMRKGNVNSVQSLISNLTVAEISLKSGMLVLVEDVFGDGPIAIFLSKKDGVSAGAMGLSCEGYFCVQISPELFGMDKSIRNAIIAHELGHIENGDVNEPKSKKRNIKKEIAADKYAAGLVGPVAMIDAFYSTPGFVESTEGKQRMEAMEVLLDIEEDLGGDLGPTKIESELYSFQELSDNFKHIEAVAKEVTADPSLADQLKDELKALLKSGASKPKFSKPNERRLAAALAYFTINVS